MYSPMAYIHILYILLQNKDSILTILGYGAPSFKERLGQKALLLSCTCMTVYTTLPVILFGAPTTYHLV